MVNDILNILDSANTKLSNEKIANMLGNIPEKLSISPDIITLMITRPLSGSAALGVFSDIVNSFGADSFTAKLAAIMVGSSERKCIFILRILPQSTTCLLLLLRRQTRR